MFCKYCGTEIPNDAEICPKCFMNTDDNPFDNQHNPNYQQSYNPNVQQGYNPNVQQGYNPNMQQPYNPNPYGQQYPDNSPATTGLKILSFFIPIAGIILYFVDRDHKPQSAKDCLKMALIAIGVSVGLYLLLFLLLIVVGVSNY